MPLTLDELREVAASLFAEDVAIPAGAENWTLAQAEEYFSSGGTELPGGGAAAPSALPGGAAAPSALERSLAEEMQLHETRAEEERIVVGKNYCSVLLFFGVFFFKISVKTAVPDDGRPPGAIVLKRLSG